MSDLANDIEAAASEPRKASGDSGSMEAHSLPDQIEADKYIQSNAAVANTSSRGIRFNKIVPPGSI